TRERRRSRASTPWRSATTGAATTRAVVSSGPDALRWASPSSWCAVTARSTASRRWSTWIASRSTAPILPRRSHAERVGDSSSQQGAAMFKRLLAVSLGALIGCSTPAIFGQARAAEKEPPGKAPTGSKAGLPPESLPKVLALVRPQENEWRHLKV